MRYLLDTGVWLWSVGPVERLNRKARELIADGSQEILLSAASSWEICIKAALGKLSLPESPRTYVPRRITEQGILPLAMTHAHALAVFDLPNHHQDPFDRLIIAQAQLEELSILTADRVFRQYPVELFWCGK
jgi:PIN domain nuclease of toxin-antitoxin system